MDFGVVSFTVGYLFSSSDCKPCNPQRTPDSNPQHWFALVWHQQDQLVIERFEFGGDLVKELLSTLTIDERCGVTLEFEDIFYKLPLRRTSNAIRQLTKHNIYLCIHFIISNKYTYFRAFAQKLREQVGLIGLPVLIWDEKKPRADSDQLKLLYEWH